MAGSHRSRDGLSAPPKGQPPSPSFLGRRWVFHGIGRDVRRHTGIGSTLALTETSVAAVPSGEVKLAGTRSGVHGDGLADDEAISDELSDRLTRVGIADFVDFVGV
jgi:hypothetical protein